MKKFFTLTKSVEELGFKTHQELWDKVKSDGYSGINIISPIQIKEVGDNLFHSIFSTDNEDRHWDVVVQDFDLKHYKKNPVFLDSHDYSTIRSIIGRVKNISVKSGKLEGDIEFAVKNPTGALAYELAKDGFLNATSIGFIPKEFDEKGKILKSELLEISAVSVPANPFALFEKTVEKEVEVKEVKSNTLAIYAKAIKEMQEKRAKKLKEIAGELQALTEQNKIESKRKIFKALRSMINE